MKRANDLLNQNPQIQKNYYANRMQLRVDVVLAFALVGFFTTLYHTVILLILPITAFFIGHISVWLSIYLNPKSILTPIPTDIRERVSSVVTVPHRTFFWRGKSSDCQSISFYFFNIILLPEGFEKELNQEKNQAILLHEFSHSDLFDYLSLFWVLFSLSLALYYICLNILEFSGAIYENLHGMTETSLEEHYRIHTPFVFLVLLNLFNMIGLFHRKELNADFGAYVQNQKIYEHYLEDRIKRQKYYTTRFRNLAASIINKISHPSFTFRRDFITGRHKTKAYTYVFPALTMGFCSIFIPLSTAIGMSTLIVHSHFSTAALLSIPLNIVAIFQCTYFFQDAFGKNSQTKLSEKTIIWFFMFFGTFLFATGVVLGTHIDFQKGEIALRYSSPYLIRDSIIAVICVIFGYIQLAVYLWVCTVLSIKIYITLLAIYIFAFSGYAYAYTLPLLIFETGPILPKLLFSVITFTGPIILTVVIEFFAHKSSRIRLLSKTQND